MAKRTFAFELSKPTKRGMLMKQGALHRAFKYRYFVLYPGFLVYYDTETKWKVDLAKGETLGNRIGAIKLKSGSVSAARDAPKGCKFGLIVHAPDPVNKRQSYLLNAVNKGDRDDWISAVRKAIPTSQKSPQPHRREARPAEKKTETVSRPPPVTRQDTAAAAALLDSGDGEKDNETETSIDNHLDVRHNTADIVALMDTHDNTEHTQEITALNNETITEALGHKENGRNDSSDEDTTEETLPQPPSPSDVITNGHTTPTSNGPTSNHTEPKETKKPEEPPTSSHSEPKETKKPKEPPTNGAPLDTERSVESSMNIEGKVEVVTSVKILTGNGDQGEGEGEGEEEGEELVEKLRRSSAEVAIAEVKSVFTVTMVRDNTVEVEDSDSEDDSNGDGTLIPPPNDPQSSEPPTLEKNDPPTSAPSSAPRKDPSPEPCKEEKNNPPTSAPSSAPHKDPSPEPCKELTPEPSTPMTPTTPATPAITIEKVPTLRRSEEPDTMSTEEEVAAALALKTKERTRRTSAPFIEKRGFLYKEGGQRKTWKLRYFVLQPGMFTYYKTNSTTKPLGEVKLKNLQVRYPSADERKQSFQFVIHTESSWNKRNDYVIAAQSNTEMKDWVAAFKLAGQKNTTPTATPPGSSDEEATPTTQ